MIAPALDETLPTTDYAPPLSVVCDTSACTVAVGRKSVRVSATIIVMVAMLVQVYPRPVARDRLMRKVFAGQRSQRDPANSMRQTFKRAREKLAPLGIAIVYTPNPAGSDLPGFYSLSPATCPWPRRRA